MTTRKVSAGQGWQWIVQACSLVKRYPGAFLGMGVFLGIISVLPFIGGFILLILGPALVAGTCFAAQQADNGRRPEIGNLFRGFQQDDRIGSLIALCLPMVVGMIVLGILAAIILGVVAGGAISAAGGPEIVDQWKADPMTFVNAVGAGSLAIGGSIFFVAAIIIGLCIRGLTFFAIPRTLLGEPAAFDNMKASFGASRRNFGAFIVVVVLLFIGFGVLSVLLSALFGMAGVKWLGALLSNAGLYSLLGATLYFGWRDVFDDQPAGQASGQATPGMPPVPDSSTRPGQPPTAPGDAPPAPSSEPPAPPPVAM